METADDRMYLLDAGSGLRLLDRIDDPAVTAGCQRDQSLASDNEVRSDFMLKIIENEAPGIFCRRNRRPPVNVAPTGAPRPIAVSVA